ncbi:MAG: glycoside hydrolase family 97 catalytic domain-containing protein [Muribaculaceae bacterium]|nr:glycoside hydrolase family 97 catalytic domain-containing protein [Muribaculaceae bacterium]
MHILPLLASILTLSSPSGNHKIDVAHELTPDSIGFLSYSVNFNDQPLVEKGMLGLDLDNRTWEMALNIGNRKLPQPECWMDLLRVDSVTYRSNDSEWEPLYGERSKIKDKWNGATVHLSRKDASNYRLDVELRAYDEGVAFRYFFPEHPQAVFHKVVDDITSYTLPEGTMAWAAEWAQAKANRLPIDSIRIPVERALTLEYPGGYWGALTDADTDDWCLTKFVNMSHNTLGSVMYSPVDIVTYYATPWKIIMGAETPGELLENNDIILNLNPPIEIADAEEWVKPGTIMRETTLTTEGAKQTIDFCHEHNIPYMLFDWLWYVPCTSHDGDATKVIDKIDMPEVVRYGNENGVGIWLYVNQHALMKQQKVLLPLLKEWGIKGVKSGFVQYASHRWATWLHDLVRSAADNQLMMNIHDEYRPSGFSRTYPNLLTQEGILGNEEFPDATHDVTLPFTRMINGAADYTICYYDQRLKNTHAHQLAASVVYYSPLVTLFWYDKPSKYEGEPEISWFENLKTTWDDSRVLSGYPGEHVVIARRNGDDWWIGAMTNNEARTLDIPFDFLDNGKYLATIYEDNDTAETKTRVGISEKRVKKGDKLKLNLKERGGAAILLRKQ